MWRRGGGEAPCLHAPLGAEIQPQVLCILDFICVCGGGRVVKPPTSMPGPVSFHTFVWSTAVSPLLYLFLILACVMETTGYHGGGAARWTTFG